MANSPIMVSRARRRRLPRLGLGQSALAGWCDGRSPWLRGAFLVWATIVGVRLLGDSGYVSLAYWLNFGIHEVGHVLTRPILPHFLYVAAGTIVEFAVPVGAIFMFRRQNDLFGAYPVCAIWIATNLYYTAWYVADARTQRNPTAPIFGEPTTSDWTYMLGELGILTWDSGIAGCLEVLAFLFMWGGVALGWWMVFRMLATKRRYSVE